MAAKFAALSFATVLGRGGQAAAAAVAVEHDQGCQDDAENEAGNEADDDGEGGKSLIYHFHDGGG